MSKVRIINDNHNFHVFVGEVDFWLSAKELVELYMELSHTKL